LSFCQSLIPIVRLNQFRASRGTARQTGEIFALPEIQKNQSNICSQPQPGLSNLRMDCRFLAIDLTQFVIMGGRR
jgi:hypothetical protein